MDERYPDLAGVITDVVNLPTLPSVVYEVIELTDDPGISIATLSECIERDPGLSAKVLKISNSTYYGMRQYVGTLKLALVILGVREVRNIVLGVSVFEALRGHDASTKLGEDFWEHSFAVASVSKRLGAALALGLQGEDFIAGLLHDIGKMVLMNDTPDTYSALLREYGTGDAQRRCEAERKALGYDHADAAAALAAHWNLPATLSDALWCHHAGPNRAIHRAKDPGLAALTRVADRAVHDDFTVDGPCSSCEDQEAWAQLRTGRAPTDLAGRRALLEGFINELSESTQPGF